MQSLIKRILTLPAGRALIALVGAPGSGKSHVAEALREAVEGAGRSAAVLPMDGFHYDDAVLHARGQRPEKGAPHTFDVGGLAAMLGRMKRNEEAEIAVPVFDRDLEISRAGARIIPRAVEIVIVEGNYLLLNRAPWDGLAELFDLTARLDVPEEQLRARLTARWVGYGLPEAEIRRKVEDLDLPNGRAVLAESRAPDLVVQNG